MWTLKRYFDDAEIAFKLFGAALLWAMLLPLAVAVTVFALPFSLIGLLIRKSDEWHERHRV